MACALPPPGCQDWGDGCRAKRGGEGLLPIGDETVTLALRRVALVGVMHPGHEPGRYGAGRLATGIRVWTRSKIGSMT